MRRNEANGPSQPVRNLFTNPSFESASGTSVTRTNYAKNPSLEVDTNDWAANASTISRTTAEFHHGVASLATLTNGTSGSGCYKGANPVAGGGWSTGDPCSASIWVKAPSGTPMMSSLVCVGGSTGSPAVSWTANGGWEKITMVNGIFPSGATTVPYVFIRVNAVHTALTFYVDELLIEKASSPGNFFSGAAPITNLVTNPSFATNLTDWTTISASAVRVTTKGDGHVSEVSQTVDISTRQGMIYISPTTLDAGVYTISFDMEATHASFTDARVILYDSPTAATRGSATTPLIKTGMKRYTFTVTATGSFNRVYMEALGVGIPIGTKTWVDRTLVEKGATAGDYYEGQGDYTYAWSGTANASHSQQQAPSVTAIVQSSTAVVTKSSLWTSSGSSSARVTPLAGSIDTRADLSATGFTSLVTGKTYTLSATCRVASVQTGTIDSRARKIVTYHSNTSHASAQAPNVVGSTRLSVTFKVTDATAYTSLRLYNGASAGNGDIWWDDVMLIEGSNDVPYVDGSKPFAKWEGSAHASTSIGYPYG